MFHWWCSCILNMNNLQVPVYNILTGYQLINSHFRENRKKVRSKTDKLLQLLMASQTDNPFQFPVKKKTPTQLQTNNKFHSQKTQTRYKLVDLQSSRKSQCNLMRLVKEYLQLLAERQMSRKDLIEVLAWLKSRPGKINVQTIQYCWVI